MILVNINKHLCKTKIFFSAFSHLALYCTVESCVLVSCLSLTSHVHADPTKVTDLLGGWKQLQDWDDRGGSYKVTLRTPEEKPRPAVEQFLRVRPDRWSIQSGYLGAESVYLRSPIYQFLLWKKPNNPEWAIRDFNGRPDSPEADAYERRVGGRKVRYPLSVVITLDDKPAGTDPTAYEFFSSPSVHITSIKRQNDGLDSVEFRSDYSSGSMVTDPARSHVILRSAIQGKPSGQKALAWVAELKSRDFHDKRASAEQLRCRQNEFVMASANNDPRRRQQEIHEFLDYHSGDTPDAAFSLTAYGLPEPPGVVRPVRRSPWLWLVAVAGVLLALTAAFAMLRRRVARRQAAAG